MSEENEILFTQQELSSIEGFAFKNPQFRDPRLMNITKNSTDLVTLSPIQGLIFVKGNQYTGFDHIHQRHEQWTSKPNWIESKDGNGNVDIRLQNQGLFRKDSVPIFDYCNIAESVYKKENLNIEKNKRPELFEMYTGEHIHKDSTSAKYNLLVYKGTKVVHTLYPQSNKNNPKRVKGFKYTRGGVSGSWNLMNAIITIKIPYLNHKNIEKYILIFRKVLPKNIEMAIVQVNNNAGNPWRSVILGERKIDSNNYRDGLNQMELTRLQYADLRELEKYILEIDNKKGK